MEYKIVEAKSALELEQKVNALIGEGWLPSGGVSVSTYGAMNWWYYQAVVRRAE